MMAKVRVGVRAAHEVPYVDTIYDDQLAKVLTETWSRPGSCPRSRPRPGTGTPPTPVPIDKVRRSVTLTT